MLKSQKSYADAVAYRKFQIQEKIDQKNIEKEAATKYHSKKSNCLLMLIFLMS